MADFIRLRSDPSRFADWLRGLLANSGVALRLIEPLTIGERTWPPGGFPVASLDLWLDTVRGPFYMEGAIEVELEPTPDGGLLVRPLVVIPEAAHVWQQVLEALRQAVPGAVPRAAESAAPNRGGNPGLSQDEWAQRLALAMRAEFIKSRAMVPTTWEEVLRQVGWPYGSSTDSRVRLLGQARRRLRSLEEEGDPDGLLAKARRRYDALYRQPRKDTNPTPSR